MQEFTDVKYCKPINHKMVIEMWSSAKDDGFVAIDRAHTTVLKIRSVALKLFVQYGYEEVGLRQIAQLIGIQPGSLYNHIEGKQALLFDLIYEYDDALLVVLEKAIDRSALPKIRLEEYVHTYIQCGVLNYDLHLLASRERVYLDGTYGERIQQIKKARFTLLESIVDAGIAAGEFCAINNNLSVIAIGSVLNGFVIHFASEEYEHFESFAQNAYEIVLRMVMK